MRPCTLTSCVLVFALACGNGDTADRSSTPDGAAPQGAPSSEASASDFTATDLAAYERGMAREIELVKAAQAAAATAATPEARGEAIQAQFDMTTVPEGAKASGLGDRYEPVRRTVHSTLRTLDMQGKIDGPVSIDTSRISAEMKARLAKDPLAELPAGAAAALRGRLDALAAQWAEYMRLTAVAG